MSLEKSPQDAHASRGQEGDNFPTDNPEKSQPSNLEEDLVTTTGNVANAEASSPQLSEETEYLSGWRLHGITAACILAVFLVYLEISIVSTSIIAITSDLKGYDESAWIVTGYLTAYTGVLIIAAKLSEVLTYKSVYQGSLVMFTAFSGACGGAQSMPQLIAFRALQGIGAAGIYSNTILIIYRLIPPQKVPKYGAIIVFFILIADVLGPVIGGALSQQVSTWRWIFYLNVPAGVVSLFLIQFSMPASYPDITADSSSHSQEPVSKRDRCLKIDYLGAALLIGGTVLLLVAIFQGSTVSSWSSASTIGCLSAAAATFMLFFIWERNLTLNTTVSADPFFPWRFVTNRPWMGVLLTTFVVGFPFNVITINLPQSFQLTAGLNPLQAGIRLLPYLIGASIAAFLTSISCSKFKVPFVYVLLLEGVIQTAVLACLITTTDSLEFPPVGYFIVFMAGFGVGGVINILIIGTPMVVESRDLAVATGAMAQFRFLGGAIGLASTSAITNDYLRRNLVNFLSMDQISALLQDISVVQNFDAPARSIVQMSFLAIYRRQYIIIAALSGIQIIAALLLWKKKGKQLRPA